MISKGLVEMTHRCLYGTHTAECQRKRVHDLDLRGIKGIQELKGMVYSFQRQRIVTHQTIEPPLTLLKAREHKLMALSVFLQKHFCRGNLLGGCRQVPL